MPNSAYFDNIFMAEISPVYDRNSENLHKWMKRHAKNYPDLMVCRATNGPTKGGYAVGTMVGVKFVGTLMNAILRNGTTGTAPKELPMNLMWEVVPTFWEDYRRIGRCAIDTKHTWSFTKDEGRFNVSEDGSRKVCTWCYKTFEKKTIMVPREIWEFRRPPIVRLHVSVADIKGIPRGKIRALQVHPDEGLMIDHIWVKDEGEESFVFGEVPGYFSIAGNEYVTPNDDLIPIGSGVAFWKEISVEYEVAQRIVADCRARGWERSRSMIHGWENLDV